MAFDSFDQRRFFAADVAAGADKNFQIEIQIAAENIFAQQTLRNSSGNFGAENFFLLRGIRDEYRGCLFSRRSPARRGSCLR